MKKNFIFFLLFLKMFKNRGFLEGIKSEFYTCKSDKPLTLKEYRNVRARIRGVFFHVTKCKNDKVTIKHDPVFHVQKCKSDKMIKCKT
jgi:hypothetical protein